MIARVFRQVLVLALTVSGAIVLSEQLMVYFSYNAVINGTILMAFVVGSVFIVFSTAQVGMDRRWLAQYVSARRSGTVSLGNGPPSRRIEGIIPASVAGSDPQRDDSSRRVALDRSDVQMENRLAEARYIVSLLVFLGLLGTFWGLLGTISGLSEAVQSIDFAVTGTDPALGSPGASPADELKKRILVPLQSMGTAFSSSVFGLGASLILNYVALQLRQGQNELRGDMMAVVESWTPGGRVEGLASLGSDSYQLAQLENVVDRLSLLQDMGREALARQESDGGTDLLRGLLDEVSGQTVAGREHTAAVRDLVTQIDRLLREQRSERQALIGAFREEMRTLSRTLRTPVSPKPSGATPQSSLFEPRSPPPSLKT